MSIQNWLLGILQAGVGVSLAAGLLALGQRALRRRIAARWFCAVWMVLAVRLLIVAPLPALVRLPLPAGLQTLLAGPGPSGTGGRAADGRIDAVDGPDLGGGAAATIDGEPGAGAALGPDAAGAPGAGAELNTAGAGNGAGAAGAEKATAGAGAAPVSGAASGAVKLLFGLWAAGCGGVLVWRVWGHLHYRRALLRWASPPEQAQRELLEREAAAMGLSRRVQGLRLVQSAEGPLLLGLVRPVLALPPLGEGGAAAREDLALVLRHELAHLARRDLAGKALLSLACALHWANPAVWWMARRAAAEMELACDDLVTQNASPAARRSYGEAILAAASGRGGWHTAGLCTGFWGGKSGLHRRFEHLVDGPARPRRRMTALFCLLAALVLAGSWLLGAFAAGAADAASSSAAGGASAAGEPAGAAASAAGDEGMAGGAGAGFLTAGWQQQVVDFRINAGAFAAPVFAGDGETITAMQCEKRGSPEHWQKEDPAVKMSLLLPEGWAMHPAAEGEEVFASGNGISAPFNLTDEAGEWVGTMQYGSFTADQVADEGGFYGGGSHAAYYWLWANPGGFGWDEASCRPAAGDAALDDPQGAGALLCKTTGTAQAGHEGVLAHDGALGRFVVIELRAGALTEAEQLALAGSIRLTAGDAAAEAVPALAEKPELPAGYAWQETRLIATGALTESRSFTEGAAVRLALPEGYTLRLEEPESARTAGPSAAVILRGDEAVGRIECITFAAPAPLDWPVENPREIYATLMMAAHAGWDFEYEEIARSETMSIATCLVGREAYPHGPGPEAPEAGREPENFKDGWWYQKGILCADNTLGVYAAVELNYGDFSDTVCREIALSVRLAEE